MSMVLSTCKPISGYMRESMMGSSQVDASRQSAVCEHDAILADESCSFLRDSDTKRLEQLGSDFLTNLTHVAQVTTDSLGIRDICFESKPKECFVTESYLRML